MQMIGIPYVSPWNSLSYICTYKYIPKMIDIQSALDRLGVSRRELANRLGVSHTAVNSYVNGNPTAERIEAIAKALNIPISSLFSDPIGVIFGFVYIGGTIHELRSVGDLEKATDKAQRLAEGTDTTE